MKWKSIILALAIILGNWCFSMNNVQAQTLQFAGPTKVGDLYVDTDKTSAVKKDGAYYLTVFAEEKYTNKVFLRICETYESCMGWSLYSCPW